MKTRLLALAAAGALALVATTPAQAARGGTCESFKVVVNGQTFSGTQKRTTNGPINSIFVDGTYIEFRVKPVDARRLQIRPHRRPEPAARQEPSFRRPHADLRQQGPTARQDADGPVVARDQCREPRPSAQRGRADDEDPGQGLPPGRPVPDGAGAGDGRGQHPGHGLALHEVVP
jgi:hypothetical protein